MCGLRAQRRPGQAGPGQIDLTGEARAALCIRKPCVWQLVRNQRGGACCATFLRVLHFPWFDLAFRGLVIFYTYTFIISFHKYSTVFMKSDRTLQRWHSNTLAKWPAVVCVCVSFKFTWKKNRKKLEKWMMESKELDQSDYWRQCSD